MPIESVRMGKTDRSKSSAAVAARKLAPFELIYWDGKLRAEYRQEKLAEYDCRWNDKEQRPQSIDKPKHFETTFSSRQRELFEVSWLREPIEEIRAERKSAGPVYSEQLKLPFSKAA